MVLDFENGELRPHHVADIFPDLQLIVANTYGHTSEAPRFRVIILTSAPVGPAAYEALWDAVANKLRDAGYVKTPKSKSTLKRSGLDYSKRAATSLFYLPAQAADPTESFFTFYNDESRQPLNPEIWLRNVRLETPHEAESLTSSIPRGDRAALQAAIDKWRATPPGQGNEQFYLLALELKRLGATDEEIEQTLLQEASFGRSPAERRNQIPSIMRSLRRHGRAA